MSRAEGLVDFLEAEILQYGLRPLVAIAGESGTQALKLFLGFSRGLGFRALIFFGFQGIKTGVR